MRSGLSPPPGWSMKVSMDVEEEEDVVSIVGRPLGMVTEGKVTNGIEVSVGDDQGMERENMSLNGVIILPDLNAVMAPDDMLIDS